MTDVKLLRLTTGEDIVAEVTNQDYADNGGKSVTTIKKPFVLIPMQGQPGKPMQIGFHPYIPYTKDEVIHIKESNIITDTTPDDNMIGAYQQNTGQIVTPKSKIIT